MHLVSHRWRKFKKNWLSYGFAGADAAVDDFATSSEVDVNVDEVDDNVVDNDYDAAGKLI